MSVFVGLRGRTESRYGQRGTLRFHVFTRRDARSRCRRSGCRLRELPRSTLQPCHRVPGTRWSSVARPVFRSGSGSRRSPITDRLIADESVRTAAHPLENRGLGGWKNHFHYGDGAGLWCLRWTRIHDSFIATGHRRSAERRGHERRPFAEGRAFRGSRNRLHRCRRGRPRDRSSVHRHATPDGGWVIYRVDRTRRYGAARESNRRRTAGELRLRRLGRISVLGVRSNGSERTAELISRREC